MLLSTDRDADSGAPAHEEKDADHPGHAGPEASWRGGRGGVVALPPIRDHAKPGDTPPLLFLQIRPSLPLVFPRRFYSRSLIFQW
jgi:hypothetical protein